MNQTCSPEAIEPKLEELRELFFKNGRLYSGLADINNLIKKFDEVCPPPPDQKLFQAREALLDIAGDFKWNGDAKVLFDLIHALLDALEEVRDPREQLSLYKNAMDRFIENRDKDGIPF